MRSLTYNFLYGFIYFLFTFYIFFCCFNHIIMFAFLRGAAVSFILLIFPLQTNIKNYYYKLTYFKLTYLPKLTHSLTHSRTHARTTLARTHSLTYSLTCLTDYFFNFFEKLDAFRAQTWDHPHARRAC